MANKGDATPLGAITQVLALGALERPDQIIPQGGAMQYYGFGTTPKEMKMLFQHKETVKGNESPEETSAKQKTPFWQSRGGDILKSLMGMLAFGGLGAGIGAMSSPGAEGLGARRGAAYGMGTGFLTDLAARQAGAGAQIKGRKLDIETEIAKTGKASVGLGYSKLGLQKEEVEAAKRMAAIEKKYRLNPKSVTADEIAELKTWYRMQMTKKSEPPSSE